MPRGYRNSDGTPLGKQDVPKDRAPLHIRFWAKVDKRGPNECWHWLGAKKPDGYGMIFTNPNNTQSHIVSLWLHGVHVPSRWETGLSVDHTCNCRDCVNPAHLEIVPHSVNTMRGDSPFARNARLKTCKQGHDLQSPGNVALIVNKAPKGSQTLCRMCLKCWPSYWNNPHRIFITA